MILVDTSIWIDHLNHDDPVMTKLLNADAVMLHPSVYGEIMLGNLKDRPALRRRLSKLPPAPTPRHDEVYELIETQRLFGAGIGLVDAHLLASTLMSEEHLLWTRDRRLANIAERLGVDATTA
jgi:hypothetical protein